MMRLLLISTFCVLANIILAQNQNDYEAKDVRVRLYYPTEQQDFTGESVVSFKVNGIEYTARHHHHNTYIFDSIPRVEGTIYLKTKGFQTQWYTVLPWDNKKFDFNMGKSGCKYTFIGKYLYPYYDKNQTIAVQISGIEKDSTLLKMKPFFDSLNLKIESYVINRHNKKLHIKLNSGNNLHKMIFKILEHPHCSDAGEFCNRISLHEDVVLPYNALGFFSTEFKIKFKPDIPISKEKINNVLANYQLEKLDSSGDVYEVKLTKHSPGTVTEVIKMLMKEVEVDEIYPRIKYYEQPPNH